MLTTVLFFIFIPLLAFILLTINLLFAPNNPYQEKDSPFECGFHSFLGQNRTQFSISFFIFALLFLLFDLEILLVYPYIVSAYTNNIYGLVIMLIFFIILTLGFAFELGKKALFIENKQVITMWNKNIVIKSKVIYSDSLRIMNVYGVINNYLFSRPYSNFSRFPFPSSEKENKYLKLWRYFLSYIYEYRFVILGILSIVGSIFITIIFRHYFFYMDYGIFIFYPGVAYYILTTYYINRKRVLRHYGLRRFLMFIFHSNLYTSMLSITWVTIFYFLPPATPF